MDSDEPEKRTEGEMGFLDHLEDLRWTLVKAATAFVLAIVLVAFFLRDFAAFLNWPLQRAMGEQVVMQGLITTSPMAVFTVLLQLCFLGGLAISAPFILYFLAGFLAPALTPKEKRLLLPGCVLCLVLFLVGAIFSYLVLVPGALSFSIRLNEMLGYQLLWTADRYYSLLVWMILGIGFCFQFPLILCILVYAEVVTAEKLRSGRRYMIVLFFVAGAIITPTWDPVTQCLVALPMWLLYEVSLLFADKIERKALDVRRREAASTE